MLKSFRPEEILWSYNDQFNENYEQVNQYDLIRVLRSIGILENTIENNDWVKTEDSYMLTVDVPGYSFENIDIKLKDNHLCIASSSKPFIEHWCGPLPKDTNPGTLKATCKHGRLTITVNMLETIGTRMISVPVTGE